MDSILFALRGKEVEINFSNSLGFRGTIESVDNGVIKLTDESEKIYYLAISKIAAVCEVAEPHLRPGFIA